MEFEAGEQRMTPKMSRRSDQDVGHYAYHMKGKHPFRASYRFMSESCPYRCVPYAHGLEL